MAFIRAVILLEGSLGEKAVTARFDNSIAYACLRPDIAGAVEEPKTLRHPMEVATASEGHYVKITQAMRADFYHNDIRLSDEFMVVPGLSEEAIIGVNTLQKWRIKLDFEHDTIIIDPKVAKLILKELK
jgi:hypothetical protein